MTKTADGKIDEYVYKKFEPLKPAKIMDVQKKMFRVASLPFPPSVQDMALLKYINGSTEWYPIMYLNSFTGLIDDHKRKLAKHTSKLPLLAKL